MRERPAPKFGAMSTVTRILTNQAGTRVTGVEYYDDKQQKQTQEASVVVLAAWAAQNPRLLLNSATDKHAKGLGNASGLVGHFMMTHNVASTWAMFDEDVKNHMGTIAVQYMSYERYAKTSHPGAFGSSFVVAGFALKTSDLANSRGDLFGPDLADYMKRAARNLAGIKAFGEDQPEMENRVELTSDKDEFGMPLGKLIHSYRPGFAGAVECQSRRGIEGCQGERRQGSLVGAGWTGPDQPSDGRHHHGDRRCQFRRRQLWPEP